MRQVLQQELVRLSSVAKRKAGALGAGAVALGAASLVARDAGSQAAVVSANPIDTTDDALAAAEPVLVAAQDLAEQAVPMAFGVVPVVPGSAAVEFADAVGAVGYAPVAVPFTPLTVGQPAPASSLVGNLQQIAQATPADAIGASATGGSESFWPEGHWADDQANGGFLGTALGVGGGLGVTALLAAGGWYAWQYIYGQPSFDHSIVYLKFKEGLCGDPVYTAPGKGRELTYSIVENLTDDSSLLEIDPETGEITFIDDPQVDSPGDLDRDGVYKFVVEIEDGNGNTATQVVELTIEDPSDTPFVFEQDSAFLQHGASTCADDVTVTATAFGPSVEDISTGQGNDFVDVQSGAGTVGIELGSGGDTLKVSSATPTSFSVDVGTGRDTILLAADVLSLEIENFDEDDLLNLAGYGDLTLVAPVVKDGSTKETATDFTGSGALRAAAATPGQTVQLFSSEEDALDAISTNEFAFYQNGEDTFMVIEGDGTADPDTTIKFEDVVLTDYSNLVFI